MRDVAGQGSRGGPDHHHHPAAQGAWGRCDGGHLLPGPLGIAGRVHRGSDPVVRGSGSAWSAGPGRWSRSLPGVWADQLTVGEVGSAWVKVGAAAVTPAGGSALVLPRALRAGSLVSVLWARRWWHRDGGRFASGTVGLGCAHQDEVGEICRANLGGGTSARSWASVSTSVKWGLSEE